MQTNSLLQPEFVNRVINHIDNLRRDGRCPYTSRIDGMDVKVDMPHLAIVNIALLYDMGQIRVSCLDGTLYVRLAEDVRAYYVGMNIFTHEVVFDDESYDQLLRGYIDYVANSCQKGIRSVRTFKWFYEQHVVCADLPF